MAISYIGELAHIDQSLFEQICDLDSLYMDYPWSFKEWQSFKNGSIQSLVVVEVIDELVVGFCVFEYSEFEWAHLLKIATATNHRSQGIEKELFRKGFNYLNQKKIERCTLEVHADNERAISLYQKLGFHEFLRSKGFYKDGGDALKMLLTEDEIT